MKSHNLSDRPLAEGGKKATERRKRKRRKTGGGFDRYKQIITVPMCRECDIAEVGTAGKRSMGGFLLIRNP